MPKNSLGSNDKLLLLKISSKENNKPNVFVTIESQTEPINFEDELQNILMHRGIMFDILIQKILSQYLFMKKKI